VVPPARRSPSRCAAPCALELEITGASTDLHSGNFGGALRNPTQALCELIAQLHERDGRIAIPPLPRAGAQRLAAKEGRVADRTLFQIVWRGAADMRDTD